MVFARPPFNGALYGLSQAIVVVGTVPNFLPKYIRAIGLGIVAWISYILVCTQTTSDFGGDLGLGSSIVTQFLIAFDYMLLSNPDEMKDLTEHDASKVTERPFKARFIWALKLYANPRGVGWSHEPPHLPRRPQISTPRWTFAFSRIRRAVLCILFECSVYVIDASNPGMTTPDKLLSDSPFPWRALGVAGFAIAGCARITMLHSLLAAFAVGLGFSTPARWPNLFGSPLDAWSVQRLWRRVWHQMLRKSVLATTSFLTSSFYQSSRPHSEDGRSTPLSLPHKILRLYTAFFLVAVMHIGGEYMLLGKFGTGAFKFFMLQPFAITFEVGVAAIWNQSSLNQAPSTTYSAENFNGGHDSHNGDGEPACSSAKGFEKSTITGTPPQLWIRCVGYLWVATWSTWTVAYMIDPCVSVGMFTDPRVDLRKIGWWQWS